MITGNLIKNDDMYLGLHLFISCSVCLLHKDKGFCHQISAFCAFCWFIFVFINENARSKKQNTSWVSTFAASAYCSDVKVSN